MTTQRPPTIDLCAALKWAGTPVRQSPWLHEEVARRMAERLNWIKLEPRVWAHWGPLQGGIGVHPQLAARYPESECYVVEASANRLRFAYDLIAEPWWSHKRWFGAATRFESPAEGAAEMLWANMALHQSADPQALIAQWHHALAVDGFLMFSCLGPDTLCELRRLYAAMGWPPPSHEFTDMHDWGDMLVAAGFAEPVMDMERITLTFETPQRLIEELRPLGRNLHPGRFGGLRGKAWLDQLHNGLMRHLANPTEQGRLTLTFEVIYGHALKSRPRLNVRSETTLSLDDMRRALRQGKAGLGGPA